MIDEVYGDGEDTSFAYFRCFAREWEVAAKAALGFAKASDGKFASPMGEIFETLADAVAYVGEDLRHDQDD